MVKWDFDRIWISFGFLIREKGDKVRVDRRVGLIIVF